MKDISWWKLFWLYIIVVFTLEIIFATGDMAKNYHGKKGKTVFLHFPNKEELAQKLLKTAKNGDVVLFKGSRAMKLDEICKKIIDNNLSPDILSR